MESFDPTQFFSQLGGVGALAAVVWWELRKLREAFSAMAERMAVESERSRQDSDRLARIEGRIPRALTDAGSGPVPSAR